MAQSAREADRFLELPYHITLVRDEVGEEESWTARVEELPGCEARDHTPEGAARGVSRAMEDWLADNLALIMFVSMFFFIFIGYRTEAHALAQRAAAPADTQGTSC